MFGKNEIRDDETKLDGGVLAVQDIFETIQGEGPQQGRPCVFVRLAGCNLACSFCDTEFESGINNRMSVDEITYAVTSLQNYKLVVLTGGEPLRQNIIPLLTALGRNGVRVIQIETAGTLWVEGLEHFILGARNSQVQLVCSPKTPKLHGMIERHTDHYKYVIEAGRTDALDGLPAFGTQTRNLGLPQHIARPKKLGFPQTIWVSPCDAHDAEQSKRNLQHTVDVAFKHGYRLSLQQHKILGLP